MIKLYKDRRGKAVNTSGWGLDEEGHAKKYLEDGKETRLTIKAFLQKNVLGIMHLIAYMVIIQQSIQLD